MLALPPGQALGRTGTQVQAFQPCQHPAGLHVRAIQVWGGDAVSPAEGHCTVSGFCRTGQLSSPGVVGVQQSKFQRESCTHRNLPAPATSPHFPCPAAPGGTPGPQASGVAVRSGRSVHRPHTGPFTEPDRGPGPGLRGKHGSYEQCPYPESSAPVAEGQTTPVQAQAPQEVTGNSLVPPQRDQTAGSPSPGVHRPQRAVRPGGGGGDLTPGGPLGTKGHCDRLAPGAGGSRGESSWGQRRRHQDRATPGTSETWTGKRRSCPTEGTKASDTESGQGRERG